MGLKVLTLKSQYDVGGPWDSFNFDEMSKIDILKLYYCKVSGFESLCLFKSDFKIIKTKRDGNSPYINQLFSQSWYKNFLDENLGKTYSIEDIDFSKYDVIWCKDPFFDCSKIKKEFPRNLFVYENVEHWSESGFSATFDYLLDHNDFSLTVSGRRVSFPYPRDLNTVSSLFDFKKIKGSVWIDWRDIERDADLCKIFNENILKYTHNRGYFHSKDSVDYYKNLLKSEYFVSSTNRLGQSLIDAAVCGCICFGSKSSGNHPLVCHPDNLFQQGDYFGISKRLKEIEGSDIIKKTIREYQDEKLKEIYVDRSLSLIKELCQKKQK